MPTHHRILIIDQVHPVLQELLKDYEVDYRPDITVDTLAEALDDVTVLLMRTKLQLTNEWIDKAPNLKFVGRLGSGMDNIDVEYAESKGIVCHNAPEGNKNAVAEQTLGMLLSLLSNVPRASAEVRQFIWDRKSNEGIELQNLVVGIIGFGHVGSRLAELLRPFGCKVLAYDKYKSDFGNEWVKEVSLEYLQNEADIITLHVSLNDSSYEMIDHLFIQRMNKSFFILNLARGLVVKISELINGLESGKIRGAAIDVLPNERMDTLTPKQREELIYLSENKNVILTPHVGGITKDSNRKLAEVIAKKLLRWMDN
mgnify:FL=1